MGILFEYTDPKPYSIYVRGTIDRNCLKQLKFGLGYFKGKREGGNSHHCSKGCSSETQKLQNCFETLFFTSEALFFGSGALVFPP